MLADLCLVQDPLAYDRLVRRFQTAAEREAEGKKKGYSGVLEADLWRSEAKIQALARPDKTASMRYVRGRDGEIIAEEKDEVPRSKQEGWDQWRKEMELRFMSGEDEDFDYGSVDSNEEYDDRKVQEREQEEAWFDAEEPAWVSAGGMEMYGEDHSVPKGVTGQTGVQDF